VRAVPPERLARDSIVNVKGLVVTIAAAAVVTGPAGAQGVRVTGVSALQVIDVRPLVEDSVPIGQASGTGPYRLLPDGTVVRCVTGEAFCRFLSSGDRETAAPLVQDLRAVVWGLGQGISAQAHVRARGSLGRADASWPRADDHFDAIEAGQHQVQDHHIDGRRGRALDRLRTAARRIHLVALLHEPASDQHTHPGVVFDEKNPHAQHSARSSCRPPSAILQVPVLE